MQDHRKSFCFFVVYEIDLIVISDRPHDTAADTAIGQQLGGEGRNDRITDNGPVFNIVHGQVIGQFTGAGDFNPIIINEKIDRCFNEVISMDNCLHQARSLPALPARSSIHRPAFTNMRFSVFIIARRPDILQRV